MFVVFVMVSKGPLYEEGAVMRSMTGGVFFSPLIAVGDLPPLYEEGGLSAAAGTGG